MSRFGRDERGSVAIEFAFIAAVFLAILFGTISYGFQFATRIALSYAVTEGGRAAVAGLSDQERTQRAADAIYAVVDAYAPLIDRGGISLLDPQWRETEVGRTGDIAIEYTDARFTFLPFVPAIPGTMRVQTTFVVADPSG
ncbi:TadE family protein [Parvibaculum lavamentivorans DS-1]|uniref:TadE family protein n=1 Tax=Parvibaculum lavamentivorans (strain DS-1 / DSM 13023 / NCIMB 13966) TaxID=402881 RepID=A7HP68_PARL1|nr:TadE/TadG family type IV pilus assembly protein [Parvibaculum lavamentivorans]ABS61701.1 TadE family protein [Parvibaculum lavamentivorans DS-1]